MEYKDIHICGLCRSEFTDLEEFIVHKRQCTGTVHASVGHVKQAPNAPHMPIQIEPMRSVGHGINTIPQHHQVEEYVHTTTVTTEEKDLVESSQDGASVEDENLEDQEPQYHQLLSVPLNQEAKSADSESVIISQGGKCLGSYSATVHVNDNKESSVCQPLVRLQPSQGEMSVTLPVMGGPEGRELVAQSHTEQQSVENIINIVEADQTQAGDTSSVAAAIITAGHEYATVFARKTMAAAGISPLTSSNIASTPDLMQKLNRAVGIGGKEIRYYY